MSFCICKNKTYKLVMHLSRMLEVYRVFSILEKHRDFSAIWLIRSQIKTVEN